MICFAILLAAGFSSRFVSPGTLEKQNKLLVPFGKYGKLKKPMAMHTLDLVCSMDCFKNIFFVCSNKKTAYLAGTYPVTVIYNSAPEKGQGESVRLGVLAADDAARASGLVETGLVYYFFMPCDQPLLDTAVLRLILDAARPGCIVAPQFKGHQFSPCLFSATFRDELLALKPGEYPRLLKSRHPQSVITVEPENPGLLADIDTPEDLKRLEGLMRE
jgi:molybdenum cofactor cytidylyltransferase